ncbi:alpha/beta hydrolase [Brumimicrobium aurantiacum]|uniref:Alpha/beta fold hydrolase n=1 Tax=Brumimicrobium aurantiacum TaxID=1737063 RepID=A0A3E1F1C4_9FLAO|nr:alpha/beta hydrolase [Brumimicrobium aurantiacum]RFC55605.1 alpha/beta fold hydrolase [Brumimicrobium aurantiacum]
MKKKLVKLASVLFPTTITKFAFDQLMNPQVRKLRQNELEVLDKAEKETFKFNDFDIQLYTWKGGGKTVFLIHGWEGQAGNFSDFIAPLLKDGYTIYAFDGPSHGFSSKGETSLLEFANLVGVLIDKYKVNNLISHSFGGVATTYALHNNPDLEIDKYALITTPDKFEERIDDVAEMVGINEKVKSKLITKLEKETNMDVLSLNVSDFVKNVNVKNAIIFHDKNDKVIPIERSRNVQKNWNVCDFKEVEGTGHFRILRTKEVIEGVVEYLAKKNKPSRPKKLTKKLEREFFKLIIDEEFDYSTKIQEYLIQFPALANSVVTGMSKGIDGFSSLMLAVRFYNFNAAKILVQNGANVNFIDSSDVRERHYPIFIDYIEMMRNLIEGKQPKLIESGFELWDLFDENGLDYSIKSISNDGCNTPDSYIEAFIRLIGVKYKNKHLVHNEYKYDPPNPSINIYRFSNESQDKSKESFYKRMAIRLLEKISVQQLKEVDASNYRSFSSAILPFYIENGYVDNYVLSLVNHLIKKKHGFELKNIKSLESFKMRSVEIGIERFSTIEYQYD